MTAPTVLSSSGLQPLADVAQALVAGDKGVLAIDESISTCNKRFARLGIAQDEEARRPYRELIMRTVRNRLPRTGTPIEQADTHHEH